MKILERSRASADIGASDEALGSRLAVWRLPFAAFVVGAAVGVALLALGVEPDVVALAAFTPCALATVIASPVVALALLPATQAFDWVRVQSDLGSLSPRTVLIVLLFASRLPRLVALLRTRADLRLVTIALTGWWLLSPLRASHSAGDSPLRGLVTDGAFVAIVLIAVTFLASEGALKAVARGSAAGLLVLAGASSLVSLGWLSEPDRVAPARELLGIVVPFDRNYGFDVPYDAVALLLPLCVPYYWFIVLDNSARRLARREGVVILTVLIVAFLLLFQARAMILQTLLALGLAIALSGRLRWRKAALAVVGLALVAIVAIGMGARNLVSADHVSNSVRSEINEEVVSTTLREPRLLVVGIDEAVVVDPAIAKPGVGEALGSFSAVPIHNFFLADLVRGGLASLALILGVFVYAAVQIVRSGLDRQIPCVLLTAFALVIVELNLEPVRANVIGSWLVLGLCLGLEGRRAHSSVTPASSPRRRDRSPA